MAKETFTIKEFFAEFSSDDACLDVVFKRRFGNLEWCPACGAEANFYRVKNRKCYGCMHCRYHIYPLVGTIFQKSRTPLTNWFYVIYKFASARNGVAALEVQRELRCTYKTALRMTHQVRRLMEQDKDLLTGVCEADEAYIGGRRRMAAKWTNKIPLLGAVERGGRVRVTVADQANATNVMRFLYSNVEKGSTLHTDESRLYNRAYYRYDHHAVAHGQQEYVRDDDYTNTIEGFWGILKPSLRGTHRSVSKKYLDLYVCEFVWRYNRRGTCLWPQLFALAAPPSSKSDRSVVVRS